MPHINITKDDYSSRKKLEAASECFMIGALSKDTDGYPDVFVMDQSKFINAFKVLPLCDEPTVLYSNSDSNEFVGVDFHQPSEILPLEYDDNIPNNDRLDMLAEILEDHLIIFRPKVTYSKNSNSLAHKNLVIHAVLDYPVDYNAHYISVPCVNMDVTAFESKLKDLSYFTINNYNSEVMYSPEFLLCDNTLYYNEKDWEKHISQNRLWRCDDYDRLKRYRLDLNKILDEGKAFKISETLYFFNRDVIIEIQTGSYRIHEEKKVEEKKEVLEDIQIIKEEENEEHIEELDFLNAFELYTKKQGLIYKKDDLVNLHTCVKTNVLTIIAGMSGTGKTQLAMSYAEMLDLREENGNLLFLPISPSFTEPEDVLGYYSNLNNKYVPSSTGLVDLLVHAQNNVNKMHMIIFDEMNLSQIEYWFSPFISILERNPQDRFIQLYSAHENCQNADYYPSRIKINENVIFIGTVNLDETTKEISDRMLDRSFVVSLNKPDFVMFNQISSQHNSDEDKIIESNKCRNTAEYNEWKVNINIIDEHSFSTQELDFFEKAHQTISGLDSQKGISFRILRNISQYLANVPRINKGEAYFKREDSFDLLFKQTVLNKIKGSENQLQTLLGTYDREKDVYNYGSLVDVLHQHSKLSHFNYSKLEIDKKLRDLSYYGYTR